MTVLNNRRAKTFPFETCGEAGTDAGALSDMGRKSILPNRRVERIYDLVSTFAGRQNGLLPSQNLDKHLLHVVPVSPS
jgi:hypothetical protein